MNQGDFSLALFANCTIHRSHIKNIDTPHIHFTDTNCITVTINVSCDVPLLPSSPTPTPGQHCRHSGTDLYVVHTLMPMPMYDSLQAQRQRVLAFVLPRHYWHRAVNSDGTCTCHSPRRFRHVFVAVIKRHSYSRVPSSARKVG